MVSYPNKLFRGWCSNEGNPRSHILHYHIYTIRDIRDYEGGFVSEEIKTLEEYFNIDEQGIDDPYYAIFATFKLDIPRGPIKILETTELRTAVYILEELSGNKVIEIENHQDN